MELTPTIGLEIHVELKTKTKMFCGCLNDSDEKHPNINVCPVCMAHPGILPVINKEAVKKVLKTGRALGGNPPAGGSQFDRKNYFYPDLPKGYQISQYQYPLVEGGELKGNRVRRVHLEEDTGRLIHQGEESLVDFNRAGVPLMELVTEPDITSGKDAKDFCEELQLILRYLDVSDADMEKGQMRCEVNISLNMGTKVEIKNLNSFKAVEKAIDYEIERQKEILEEGGEINQETRGWNEMKGQTFSQRKKEEAHDYRYFPEPDLPSLLIFSQEKIVQRGAPRSFARSEKGGVALLDIDEIKIPELPQQKRERFQKEYNLKPEQIEILVRDKKLSDFFEETISEMSDIGFRSIERNPMSLTLSDSAEVGLSQVPAEIIFNYLNSDLTGLMNEKFLGWDELKITPHAFGELMAMVSEKKISSAVAKNVLKKMLETGKDAGAIVQEEGLEQVSDRGFIEEAVKKVISQNPKPAADYKNGKQEALQFLIGRAMKETRGKADPEILKQIFTANI